MRWGTPELLSDLQVERIKDRQKELGLTSKEFFDRFKSALTELNGPVQSDAAVKMRLDRVFYKKMRRPTTETTKLALARALDLTLVGFEETIAMENGARKTRAGAARK
jgi:hypothetical protein